MEAIYVGFLFVFVFGSFAALLHRSNKAKKPTQEELSNKTIFETFNSM